MIRTQIPRFRLPEEVIDEEIGYILDLGVEFRGGAAHRFDEGAARRRAATRSSSAAARRAAATSTSRAAQEAAAQHPHRHRLAVVGVASATSTQIGKRVIVLGGGNTAMDCCRSARRLGGERRQGDRALAASRR